MRTQREYIDKNQDEAEQMSCSGSTKRVRSQVGRSVAENKVVCEVHRKNVIQTLGMVCL